MTDRQMMDRRGFLGTLAAGALALPHVGCGSPGEAPAPAPAAPRGLDRIGVQLYTVRSEMERDVAATLARVAEIGYTEVEFAGYFDQTPQALRAMLDQNGLTAPAAHVGYENLAGDWGRVLDDASVLGHEYIVIPFLDEEIRNQPDAYERVAEALNRGAEQTVAAGLAFAYHNHQFEFVRGADGRTGFDTLAAECSPSVLFELDLFWATVAGHDPLALFAAHPGRFPLVHVKDMRQQPTLEPSESMVPFERAFEQLADVGQGTIDFGRIFAQADEAGIRHYFVENDQPASPFESIAVSYRYLEALRF